MVPSIFYTSTLVGWIERLNSLIKVGYIVLILLLKSNSIDTGFFWKMIEY